MIYLDNAATTFPKPEVMLMEMSRCISQYCGNPGRSGHGMSMKTGEMVYRTRREIAGLFGIEDGSHVVFTSNTTEGLNMAIKGVLEPGDHVITTYMEHNSVLRPLKALEQQGIRTTAVRCDKEGRVRAEDIAAEIKENTKLIICTHASNVTGTVMPISEIGKMAKEKGILFLVDGAQSGGCVPIHVKDMCIDLLALPGHKGLLGPLGTGFLYVRPGVKIRPLMEGGTGTVSRDLRQPDEFPEGFESGTVNAPGIIGLGASVKWVKSVGVSNIGKYEEELILIMEERLRNISRIKVYGPEKVQDKTGIITFNIEGMGCEEVSEILNSEFDIACRSGYHCAGLAHKTIGTANTGAVRVSVGPFNTKKEVKTASEAIYRICQR